MLLSRCTHALDPATGYATPLTPEVSSRLTHAQELWAGRGQRVLLLARRIVRRSDIPNNMSFHSQVFADFVNTDLNQGLTVVGLVGLVDPPKPDIPQTVKTLRGAYIRMCMITGDHPATSVEIARQCGIITNAQKVDQIADLDREIEIDAIEKYDAMADRRVRSLVLTGTDLMKMVRKAATAANSPLMRSVPSERIAMGTSNPL